MDATVIYSKINSMPEQLRIEVLDFIDFLLQKKNYLLKEKTMIKEKKSPRFGSAKGIIIKMDNDFDEPLDDFKEYM